MNCRVAQKKIMHSLASGMATVSLDVAEHARSCAACQAFYEQEQALFCSIEAGLQTMVNQPVPLSCFVRVRARLEESPASRLPWTPRWTYAALAASLLLILSGAIFRKQFPRGDSSPEANRGVARADREPVLEVPPTSGPSARLRPAPVRVAKTASIPPDQPEGAVPQVIVLAEEKQAFARFVARVPSGIAVPSALKPTEPQPADAAMDIALIEIQEVEIAPLDLMNGDGQ